jgi:hypothetical protein
VEGDGLADVFEVRGGYVQLLAGFCKCQTLLCD